MKTKACGHDETNPDCDWLCCPVTELIQRRDAEREEKRREKGEDWARDERLGRFYGVEVES